MRNLSRSEILDILVAIESVQTKLRDACACQCGGAALTVETLELRDRLRSLYACLPVSALIEYVSEAGCKTKGAA